MELGLSRVDEGFCSGCLVFGINCGRFRRWLFVVAFQLGWGRCCPRRPFEFYSCDSSG